MCPDGFKFYWFLQVVFRPASFFAIFFRNDPFKREINSQVYVQSIRTLNQQKSVRINTLRMGLNFKRKVHGPKWQFSLTASRPFIFNSRLEIKDRILFFFDPKLYAFPFFWIRPFTYKHVYIGPWSLVGVIQRPYTFKIRYSNFKGSVKLQILQLDLGAWLMKLIWPWDFWQV